MDGTENNITGLIGPWGITPDTPEQLEAQRGHWTSNEDRDVREFAIEQAVRALVPVAGAYDLPTLVCGRHADYGDAIITLAQQLGDYIKNGEPVESLAP